MVAADSTREGLQRYFAACREKQHAKIAINGCGKIADAHASAIQRIKTGRISPRDREELMARQLTERFPVDRAFRDLDVMLTRGATDVVHVTTSPQSHFRHCEAARRVRVPCICRETFHA
jgi:predicted dehydrogenase